MTPHQLHHEAMRLYGQGKLSEALALEEKAARMLPPNAESEPTRSVLFRSAANMARQLGKYDLASDLAYEGLKGVVHAEMRRELLAVLEGKLLTNN